MLHCNVSGLPFLLLLTLSSLPITRSFSSPPPVSILLCLVRPNHRPPSLFPTVLSSSLPPRNCNVRALSALAYRSTIGRCLQLTFRAFAVQQSATRRRSSCKTANELCGRCRTGKAADDLTGSIQTGRNEVRPILTAKTGNAFSELIDMAATSTITFITDAFSQTVGSDIFAPTSSTTSIPRFTANSTIPSRKCEVTCCSSLRPDGFARDHRNLYEKRHKETRTKMPSWPTNSIFAEIQRDAKDKLSADLGFDDLVVQDPPNHGHGGTSLNITSLQDIHQLKDEKKADTQSSRSANGAQAITAQKINPQGQMTESSIRKRQIGLTERSHQAAAQMHSSRISSLAEENAVCASKMFYYPESPEAGSEMEIFLNRSITSLADQPSILMKGSYNDWRWKSFVAELKKTNLPGDWWSCKLEVPKEVYRIDFVFFDGKNLYENNSMNDFFAQVENGMQKEAFEDYLMEQKRKEVEMTAAEKAKEELRKAQERKLAEAKAGEILDRLEAKQQVNDQQEKLIRVLQRAVKCVDGLWYFQPSDFQGGDTVRLFYNRAHRSLESCEEVWIHGGYNNWEQLVSVVGKLSFFSDQGGDWWAIDVELPKQAFVLNWVFADGPPEHAVTYDNNSYQDFHALVPKGVPADLYWAGMEEQLFVKLQEERHKQKEASHRKAERTAVMKAELKARTKINFLRSQAHIFYTDPVDVQAGKPVTVFYNPSNTILNGKPEVWLRGSFNRWTHRLGCLPPVKMFPAGTKTHLKGNFKVPLDAYLMDFVFSERGGEDGGVYDNRSGLDYHTPVGGGIAKEPPMQIVHISVEMAPIAKVGGLGDVVTSLSRAVQDLGHNVEVVLPKYDCLKYNHIANLQQKADFFWGGTRIKVWNGKVEGLSVHFLEPENGMFWVGCVYGRRDDGRRFEFFCNAALEFLSRSGRHLDIIHCHDWSSAPVAWLFQENYKHRGLSNARVVFTIHNLEFGMALIGKAMAHTHKATTVSATYAKEVSANPAIAPHLLKFHGIRNGIDLDIWDPYNDPILPVSYTSSEVVKGKRAAKCELQQRLGLAQLDRPLVGIITRLTAQKGIHLIKHAIWRTLDRNGQVVLLGSAPDPRIQNDFNSLAKQLHNSQSGMARLCLHYDEPLSHLIYAGADFILIPSMFEPCGLTQLTAMRYGAIPVVRRTGGLNDTVFDVDHDRDRALSQGIEPNGFSFDGTDGSGVDYALNRALSAWYDARDWINGLCKQVMEQDWSWNRPALDYLELYYGAKK